MENLITWLERQIELCDDLKSMEKEKWAFIQTLKKVRKEAINYTRCSTQLKLVYTSDFCKWLETNSTYYDKTSDFLNRKGSRMTLKELVTEYEQEQNKKALIV